MDMKYYTHYYNCGFRLVKNVSDVIVPVNIYRSYAYHIVHSDNIGHTLTVLRPRRGRSLKGREKII